MNTVLWGLVTGFALVAALFFFRFARRSGDHFFDYFAAAFALLALNGFLVGVTDPDAPFSIGIYLLRLVAFVIIALGILKKNRE